MGKRFTLTRAAELEALPIFREFVAQACATWHLPEETCFALQLVVDEACSNVIIHGYADMNPGSIMVELEEEGQGAAERIVMRITDFGHPFEPSQAPPPPDAAAVLTEDATGGFGLHFIYQSMDTVDYRTDEEGNCLTLTKRVGVR